MKRASCSEARLLVRAQAPVRAWGASFGLRPGATILEDSALGSQHGQPVARHLDTLPVTSLLRGKDPRTALLIEDFNFQIPNSLLMVVDPLFSLCYAVDDLI